MDWNCQCTAHHRLNTGHTLRGCVDWNKLTFILLYKTKSHTLRGCVDWNCQCTAHHRLNTGHTLRGCVDWNFTMQFVSMGKHCHTLRGCVDWNSLSFTIFYYGSVTPCVGVWIETSLYHVSALTTSVTPCVGVWIETILRIRTGGTQQSHTLRGCVDWNHGALLVHDRVVGHTLRGCVDWNV